MPPGRAPSCASSSPTPENIVSGTTRIQIVIEPEAEVANVRTVTFSVNGRLACTVERPPFACALDPGDVVRGHHIRVVATLTDGRRLVDNLRTKDLGYAERIRTDAVLVPVDRHRRRPVRARAEAAGLRDVRGRRRAADRQPRQRGCAARSRPGHRRQRQHGAGARRGEAGGQAAAVEAAAGRRRHAASASTTPCSSPPSARRTAGRARRRSIC